MRSKRAIYNVLSSLMLQIVVLISGFIIPKLIIKTYGSNVNGLVTSITQFLAYISLLESGIGPVIKASLNKVIANKDKKGIANVLKSGEKFFRVIAIIFIFYLIILSIVYPFGVINEFNYFYTLSLILIIAISTFFEYFFGMTYKLFLQANQRNYVFSIIQIGIYILNVIFVVIFIKLGFNIQIVKLVSSFIFVLRPIIQYIYVKKKFPIDLKSADKNYKLEQKWDGLAQHIAAVVHGNTDVMILTFLSSLKEVSVYSVYNLIVKGIKSIIQSFSIGIDDAFGDMIAKGEKKLLNKNFNVYELYNYTLSTIVYTCALILIVPFVGVYTSDIYDANYIRPLFATLIVLSEFVWSIRLPYSSITLAAGHFKETKKGAVVEALVNIILSVILVIKFKIVGVAIGTLIAMIIRTIEFLYHTNKYILERNLFISIKKIFVTVFEVIIICILAKYIKLFEVNSYFDWFIYAIIIFTLASVVVIIINSLVYKNETKDLIEKIKSSIKRRKK